MARTARSAECVPGPNFQWLNVGTCGREHGPRSRPDRLSIPNLTPQRTQRPSLAPAANPLYAVLTAGEGLGTRTPCAGQRLLLRYRVLIFNCDSTAGVIICAKGAAKDEAKEEECLNVRRVGLNGTCSGTWVESPFGWREKNPHASSCHARRTASTPTITTHTTHSAPPRVLFCAAPDIPRTPPHR
jgi:hypothetical protein